MKHDAIIGYEPRCELYRREQTKGRPTWYIKYYLPYGIRMRRPCHLNKREAKKLLKVKEIQLLCGEFDEKDLEKLAAVCPQLQKQRERLTINAGLQLYLETTARQRTAKAQYNDERALQKLFGWFKKQGKSYMDEISRLDVQRLVNYLDREGKSEATLKTYVRCLHKVFKWLIDDMEELSMSNPVKKVNIPKSTGLVRDRLPSHEEIQALLRASTTCKSRTCPPVEAIVRFLIFSGARFGEVCHAEWVDFDLENGIWHIRHKPHCPTKFGLGWSPKWHKERDVLTMKLGQTSLSEVIGIEGNCLLN